MSTYFNGDNISFDEDKESTINPLNKFIKHYNAIFDKLQFFLWERWLFIGAISFFFIIRLIQTQGKYFILFNIIK
jgi:hypothetical protein